MQFKDPKDFEDLIGLCEKSLEHFSNNYWKRKILKFIIANNNNKLYIDSNVFRGIEL